MSSQIFIKPIFQSRAVYAGKYCYGKTPMQTFKETKHLTAAKMLDRIQLSDK